MNGLSIRARVAIVGVRVRRFLARWGLLFVGVLFAVTFYHAVIGLVRREQDIRSAAWPSTPGTLINVEYPADDADAPDRASIRYRYHVNGQTYEGDRVSLHSTWPAREFREAHRKGSEVAVYYDPENPAVAMLQPGADEQSKSGFLYPFFFSLLLFVFLFEAVLARRLVGLIRRGRLEAVRGWMRDKRRPGVSTEAVLVAADLPDPEIFSLLVPFVAKRRLEMLTVYAEHQGTAWMRDRLRSALADRADDSPAQQTEKAPEAPRAPIPRVPGWLDPVIHRLETVYEEMSGPAQLVLVVTVLSLLLLVGLQSAALQRIGFWILFPIGGLWLLLSAIAINRVGKRREKAHKADDARSGDQPPAPSTPAQGEPAGRFRRLTVDTIRNWAGMLLALGILASIYLLFDPPAGFGIEKLALVWLGLLVIIVLGLPVCVVIAAIRYWAGARGGDDGRT